MEIVFEIVFGMACVCDVKQADIQASKYSPHGIGSRRKAVVRQATDTMRITAVKFYEMNIAQALEKMETTSNTLDKILAATWRYRLDLPNWITSLRKQMAYQEEIFHHFAYELLET